MTPTNNIDDAPSEHDVFENYASWGFPQNRQTHIPKTIRINTLRCTVDQAITALQTIGFTLTPTKIPYAFIIEGDVTLSSTLPYLNGWVYTQELSSQLPLYLAPPKPQTTVVDLAASPGSKTTQAAMHMNNTGVIVALDNVHERLEKLKSNCARLGVTNVVAYQMDASFADDIVKQADFALCDVPCSGNFTQDGWQLRTQHDLQQRQQIQQQLLESAVYATRTGGRILYTTCSLEKEENEDVVEWALQHLPVQLCAQPSPYGHPGLTPQTKNCIRIWPTQDAMGGFFIAVLEKLDE